LPAPFRPQLIDGHAIAGICLIRLAGVRPQGLPAWLGLRSENAAHRVAVEWDEQGMVRHGVYIRRRDTNLWLNALAGGRVFPGVHHHARFKVTESLNRFEVAMRSDDGQVELAVDARRVERAPAGSVFASTSAASDFFAAGSLGYSDTGVAGRYQGLELRCRNWNMQPLAVDSVRSSYFDDRELFPIGSAEFDSAWLMRGIEHEWHGQPDLCCPADAGHCQRPVREHESACTVNLP
jgi:hypothetical protein